MSELLPELQTKSLHQKQLKLDTNTNLASLQKNGTPNCICGTQHSLTKQFRNGHFKESVSEQAIGSAKRSTHSHEAMSQFPVPAINKTITTHEQKFKSKAAVQLHRELFLQPVVRGGLARFVLADLRTAGRQQPCSGHNPCEVLRIANAGVSLFNSSSMKPNLSNPSSPFKRNCVSTLRFSRFSKIQSAGCEKK